MALSIGSATSPIRDPADIGELTFDTVYRAHAQTVARWATRLAGPYADTEDLTQEIFLIVNRRLAEFRGDSTISTWLFRITANVVANDRRRRAARPWWRRLRPGVEERIVSPEDTPLDRIERRETHARFYDVLGSLRERYRNVLVLFELEEMSTSEIGELIGDTAGNVRVLLHRARAAFLKEMLRREQALARETR